MPPPKPYEQHRKPYSVTLSNEEAEFARSLGLTNQFGGQNLSGGISYVIRKYRELMNREPVSRS